jgi:hypothetical protein
VLGISRDVAKEVVVILLLLLLLILLALLDLLVVVAVLSLVGGQILLLVLVVELGVLLVKHTAGHRLVDLLVFVRRNGVLVMLLRGLLVSVGWVVLSCLSPFWR